MDEIRKFRISAGLMDTIATRDHEGNLLRVWWGEPDWDGFYTPTIWTDSDDNLLNAVFDHWPEAVTDISDTPSLVCSCGWDSESSKLDWVEHLRAAVTTVNSGQDPENRPG